MRRARQALLIIGIIFIYITPLSAQPAQDGEPVYLSLNEVLSVALLNNFDIQLSLYDRYIKGTDLGDALSIYDTVLTLTGEYNYDKSAATSSLAGTSAHTGSASATLEKLLPSGTDLSIDFENTRSSSDSAFAGTNPNYESALEMKFTQPLLRNFFGMNDWGEVRVTRIDIKNYSSEVLDDIEGDLADVEKAYWELVKEAELVRVREDGLKKAEDFYSLNKEKHQIGTSELPDLLAAEAAMELRKTELDVQRDARERAVNNLKFLINHPESDSDILPGDKEMEPAGGDLDFIESLKAAFENRRDYERAKDDIKAKKIKFNMKKNARWPQLDFEGSLRLNGVERVYRNAAADAFTTQHPEYTAKVTFSFPFEDRGARSEYDEAKYEKAKALLELKKTEKQIVTDIDDGVRRVRVYRDKVLQARKVEELQRRKLEEEERQYRYGRSDSDRVVRFQEDLLNARIAALNAVKEYTDSLIDLYLAQDVFLKERNLTVR